MSSRGSKDENEWEMENKVQNMRLSNELPGMRFIGRRLSQIRLEENQETMPTYVCPYCNKTSFIDQLTTDSPVEPSAGQETGRYSSPSLSGGSSFSGRLKEKMSVSSRLLKAKIKQSSSEIKQGVSVAKGRLKNNAALVKDSLNIVLGETKQTLSRKMAPVSEHGTHSADMVDASFLGEADNLQLSGTEPAETSNHVKTPATALDARRVSLDVSGKPVSLTQCTSLHSVSSDLKMEVDYSDTQRRESKTQEMSLMKTDVKENKESQSLLCAPICAAPCSTDNAVKVRPTKAELTEMESLQKEHAKAPKERTAYVKRDGRRRVSVKEQLKKFEESAEDVEVMPTTSAECFPGRTSSLGFKTPPLPSSPRKLSPTSTPSTSRKHSSPRISVPQKKSSTIISSPPTTPKRQSAPPFVYDSVFNATVKELIPATRLLEQVQLYGASGLSTQYFFLTNIPHEDTFKVAKMSVNAWKNRYIDTLCYDKTRVKLNPTNKKDKTDYINASFVDGYKHKNAYICCQGPTDKTCTDFWKMVWQYNVRLIVMTTRVIEKKRKKCAPYWPTDENEVVQHGDCTIINNKTYVTETRAVCSLTVKHAKSPELRSVYHLLYLVWPDYGVPSSADSFLDLVFTARTLQEAGTALISNWRLHPNGPPLIIHCSAGVGRSGTFMCADICMRMLDDVQKVNIRNVLELIRKQRAFAVQTPEQYLFCHIAVLQYAKTQNLLPADAVIPELIE